MPLYKYTAKSAIGAEIITDEINMASEQLVRDYLYVKGLVLLTIEEQAEPLWPKLWRRLESVRSNILIVFLRQLMVMIHAGIPLYRSLSFIIAHTENKRLRKICERLLEDIGEGFSFSKAMRTYPSVFPPFLISMVAVGENRGELAESFRQLVSFMEKTREIRHKVITAMIYPLILLVAGLAIMLMMVTFVLPRFIEIFVNYEVPLPLPTKILIGISNFIFAYYPLLMLLILGLIIGFIALDKFAGGRRILDAIRLYTPIWGSVYHHIALSRFIRTLGLLHRGGVPLIQALELSKDAAGNTIMAESIDEAIASVKDGKGIARPLSASRWFPPLLVQMISIGEESGSLDVLALDAADYYDQETEYRIKKQMALMEPLALLVIALLVAFIAASFLLPMFRMATALRRV